MHDVRVLLLLVNPVQSYVEVTIATMIDDSLIIWKSIIIFILDVQSTMEQHAASTDTMS